MPKTVMVDTLTSAGLQRALGEAPVGHPQSLDCATHTGLPIAPCHVGKGHAKGRVANGVGSVTKPSRAGLERPAWSALGPAARHGLATGAHGRLPGATRDTPTA